MGSLLYLSTGTRPADITYAVSSVAKFCSEPNQQNWTAVKQILRYLKGILLILVCFSPKMAQKLHSVGYSDADWAGDLDGRRLTSSYLFKFSGAAVSWRSKKQNKCSIIYSRS